MRCWITLLLVLNRQVFCLADGCMDMKTCGECIGYADEKCVWCSAEVHTDIRCISKNAALQADWCSESFYDPPPQSPVFDQQKPLVSGKNAVQFSPQQISVKLRPGTQIDFSAYYKPAKDYPLDVYYIVDNSYSMKVYRDVLENNAQNIFIALKNLTNNVQLGVGSFVEKPTLPFADHMHTTIVPYIFKNHQALTTEIKNFVAAVKSIKSSSNYDDQEAGLDAIMQAMVCQEQLKWRRDARRIIVLCTDSPYHSFGDGKIGGAAKLNDMKCHMIDETRVDMNASVTFDYPSVGQIDKIASDGHFKIMFNVLAVMNETYEALAKQIQGAKYVELNKKSEDIVKNIKTEYLSSVQSLKLYITNPDHIKVQIEPDCNKLMNGCEVKHSEQVKIRITLKATKCSDNGLWDEISIGPVGLSERLVIKVKTTCECECEKVFEPKSEKCNKKGTFQCGICTCNENSYGPTCRCTGSSTDNQDLDKCKANLNETSYCSGHGDCLCGNCENCRDDYYGQFCENRNVCPEVNGKECSGNGKCVRGKCSCLGNVWTGSACNCDERKCLHPNTMEKCSEKGECVCGKCVCGTNDSDKYSGTFCDQCADCDSKQCKELEDIAMCHFQKHEDCNQKYKGQGSLHGRVINDTDITGPEYYLFKKCKKELADGSFMVFLHNWPNKQLQLIVQKEAEKPVKANVWIAIGSVIGAMLLIGLLTLITWKVLTHIHDCREYEKFQKEMSQARLNGLDNVLYVEPAVHFQNPMYDASNMGE